MDRNSIIGIILIVAFTTAMKSGCGLATVLRCSGRNDAVEPGVVLQLHELALWVDAAQTHAYLVGQ